MSKENTGPIKGKKSVEIIITNSPAEDAKITLEDMIKKYLLKKALELKDEVA